MGHDETRRPAPRVMVNRQVWGQSGGQGGGRSEPLHRAPIHGPCFCRWCIQERDSPSTGQGGERSAALYRAPIHGPCSCRRCMQDDEHDSPGTGQIVTGPDSENWRARPQQARRAETYLHAPPSRPTQTTNYSPPSAYNVSSPSSIPQHYDPPVPPPPPQYAPSSMPHGQSVPPRFPVPHAPPNVYQPQPQYSNNAPQTYNYQAYHPQPAPYPGPPPHPHPAHPGQAPGQGYHQTYAPHTQQNVHGGPPAPVYTHTHGQQYPQQYQHTYTQPHPAPLCATCQSQSRRPAQALPPVNAHTKAAWQALKSVTQPLAAPTPKLNPSSREFRPRSVSWPPASTGPNVQGSQDLPYPGQSQVYEPSQCPSQARPPNAANTQTEWRVPKSVTQPLATPTPNLNPYPYNLEFRPRSASLPLANTGLNAQGSHGWPQASEQRQMYCGGNASRAAPPGLAIATALRVQASRPAVQTADQRPALSNVQVSPPVLRAPPTTPNNSFEPRPEWSYPAPDFPLRKTVSTSSIITTAAKRYTVIVGEPPAQRQTAIVEKPSAQRYTVFVGEPPARRYTVKARDQSETTSQSSSTTETSSSASLSPSSSVPPRSVTPALGPPPGLVYPSALSQRGNSTVTTPTSVATAPPATVYTRSDGTTQHSPYYGQITCTGRPLYPYQSPACNLERDLARARTQRSMLAWATGAGIHKHSPSKPSPLTPNATSQGYVALLAYYYATCEKPVWGWQLARSSIKKRVDPRLKSMSAFQKLHRFHRAKDMGLDAVLDLE